MKITLTVISLLIANLTFAQKRINNTKTNKHKQVNGTRFFFVPPADFVDAKTFQGFELQENASSILVMELPGPFVESTKGFNEQGLKSQGAVLKNREEIIVNGYQGLFLSTEQSAYGIAFQSTS